MAKVYISRRLPDDTLVSVEGDNAEEFLAVFADLAREDNPVAGLIIAALVPTVEQKSSKAADVESPAEPEPTDKPEPPEKPARKRAARKPRAPKQPEPVAEPEPPAEPDEGPSADESEALIKKIKEAKSVMQLALLFRKNKAVWTDAIAAEAKARREAIEREM